MDLVQESSPMISSPLGSADTSLPLDQEKVLAALGNKLRWQMFRMLADGTAMHSAEVAREFKRDFDGISKHLRILRSAGLLRSHRASDRRVTAYFIPAEFRRQAGEIDLGFCLLRLPEAKPDSAKKPAPIPVDSTEDEIIEPEPPVQGFGEMLVNSATLGSGRDG